MKNLNFMKFRLFGKKYFTIFANQQKTKFLKLKYIKLVFKNKLSIFKI